jgi:hypothetical protein
MAKRRGGRFKKMLGLGFISFEKAFRPASFGRKNFKFFREIFFSIFFGHLCF